MHRTRPGGLNGGEMYGTRAGFGILLLLRNFTYTLIVTDITRKMKNWPKWGVV